MTKPEAYDILTIGMRLAYMEGAGMIKIDTTTTGEDSLVDFALNLSKHFPAYQEADEFGNWDTYIESAILNTYGVPQMVIHQTGNNNQVIANHGNMTINLQRRN